MLYLVDDDRSGPPAHAHKPFQAQEFRAAQSREDVERLLHHRPVDRLLTSNGESDVAIRVVMVVLLHGSRCEARIRRARQNERWVYAPSRGHSARRLWGDGVESTRNPGEHVGACGVGLADHNAIRQGNLFAPFRQIAIGQRMYGIDDGDETF